MKEKLGLFKTTLLRGLVFLLPLVVLVAVFGKAYSFMASIILPIAKKIHAETILGITVLNLIIFFSLFIICFFSGLVAKSYLGKKLFLFVENKLAVLPGYPLFKAKLTGSIGKEDKKKPLKTVLVTFKDRQQLGFEIERNNDKVCVFLPGSPDPWTGTCVIVSVDKINHALGGLHDTQKIFERLGKGSLKACTHKGDDTLPT